MVKWRIVRNIQIVGPVVYVFRRPISPRYCKALIYVLPQFIRLFKPTNSDDETGWRQKNPALLVHWDMWISIEKCFLVSHPRRKRIFFSASKKATV